MAEHSDWDDHEDRWRIALKILKVFLALLFGFLVTCLGSMKAVEWTFDLSASGIKGTLTGLFVLVAGLGSGVAVFVIISMIPTSKRKHDAGFCITCGYDLRGTPSGTCPECGTRNVAPSASVNTGANTEERKTGKAQY